MLKIAIVGLILINTLHFGEPLECYSCNAQVENNASSNEGCVNGDKGYMKVDVCPNDGPQVCVKYSYLVSGSSVPAVSRSCSSSRADPCQTIESAINIVPNILPGTRTCKTCSHDLCNSSTIFGPSILFFGLIFVAFKL